MSKKVLLIGGSGLLGKELQQFFSEDRQYTVHAPSHAEVDVLVPSTLSCVHQYDIICNATGQISHPISYCEDLNTIGMRNLIAAMHSATTLVQLSTTLVYGTASSVTEETPLHPENPYAQFKMQAEEIVQSSLPLDRYLILRLCNLFGAGQNKGLLWYILSSIHKGNPIQIQDNDGSLRRYFLHCADAACMIRDLVSAHARGVYNCCGTSSYSIRDIVALCETLLRRPLEAAYAKEAPIGNIDVISTKKLQSLISPQYTSTIEQYLTEQLLENII